MLSAEEVEGYSKDGQITSVVSLPPAMVRELRGKMQSFFEAQPGVDQDYAANLIDQDNSWLKYAMLPEILDTVRALIGDDIIVWGSALFAKKGIGGKATPWHQDGHYWPIRPLQTVTAWIAIDDVDTGNGCLRVIPTSHADQKLHDHYTEDSPDVVLNQALEVGDDRFGTPRDVELANGHRTGRHVEREMLVLYPGGRHCDGVGAEARLLGEGRQHRRLARASHAHADHATVRRHGGVDPGSAVMIGTAHGHHADAKFFCFVAGHLHRLGGRVMAEPVPGIKERGRRKITHHG